MPQCKETKKDNTPCTAAARESGFCMSHDPGLSAKRAEGSKRGGLNRRNSIRAQKYIPDVLRPVMDRLLTALEEVHNGNLKPYQGIALAQLTTALVRVYEIGVLEQRIERLEEMTSNG